MGAAFLLPPAIFPTRILMAVAVYYYVLLLVVRPHVVFSRRRSKASAPQNRTNVRFEGCKYGTKRTLGSPEVFWINLNTSVERRRTMTKFLDNWGVRHHRVEGVHSADFFIPPDLLTEDEKSFRCVAQTTFTPRWMIELLGRLYPRKLIINGLCGHTINNRWFREELAVVISHLQAIKDAIYSDTATSPYALIVEDDVWTPFNIDLGLLAAEFERETKRHFGIFQLFNSKPSSLTYSFFCMRRPRNFGCTVELGSTSHRWAMRYPVVDGRALFSLSTGAYLINRYVMKDIIGTLAFFVGFLSPQCGWFFHSCALSSLTHSPNPARQRPLRLRQSILPHSTHGLDRCIRCRLQQHISTSWLRPHQRQRSPGSLRPRTRRIPSRFVHLRTIPLGLCDSISHLSQRPPQQQP